MDYKGEWGPGGEGALDTPGPLNGTSEVSAIWAQIYEIYYTRAHKNQWSIGSFM